MIQSNNSNDSSQKNIDQTKENKDRGQDTQKMNANPNPRANENIKNIPPEKKTGVEARLLMVKQDSN